MASLTDSTTLNQLIDAYMQNAECDTAVPKAWEYFRNFIIEWLKSLLANSKISKQIHDAYVGEMPKVFADMPAFMPQPVAMTILRPTCFLVDKMDFVRRCRPLYMYMVNTLIEVFKENHVDLNHVLDYARNHKEGYKSSNEHGFSFEIYKYDTATTYNNACAYYEDIVICFDNTYTMKFKNPADPKTKYACCIYGGAHSIDGVHLPAVGGRPMVAVYTNNCPCASCRFYDRWEATNRHSAPYPLTYTTFIE